MAEDEKKDEGKASEAAELFAQHAEKTNRVLEELTALAKQQAVKPEPARVDPAKPQRHSVAQLRAAVDAGTISEDVMRETLRAYDREDLKAELRAELRQEVQTTTAASRVQTKIDEYATRIPSLRTKGSEEWNRAAEAYRQLLEDGHEEGLKTELAALRVAFPESAKTEVRETTTERTRKSETTSTAANRRNVSVSRSADPLANLEPGQRAYIETAIRNGRFKDAKDPAIAKMLAAHEDRLNGQRRRFAG